MISSDLKFIPRITKLTANVIRILGCNPGVMTLQGTNTYLIGNGLRRLLLDTGDGKVSEYFDNLNSLLTSENINISDVVITHWHQDHIGGVPKLMELLSSNCNFHKCMIGISEQISSNYRIKSVSDGDILQVDGAALKVIHTPGHTKDHIVLYLKEIGALFSGDCILGEGTTVFEDFYDYMNSLKKIHQIRPSIIYPGHGSVIEDPMTKIQAYIDHRNQREMQIMATLAQFNKPVTPVEIVKIVYKDAPENLLVAATSNVLHHLEKLVCEKRVVSLKDESDGLKFILPH